MPAPPPSEPAPPLSYAVIQLLVAMSGRLGQNFAAHAAELGLSAAEGKAMLALEPDATPSMRALARRLGFDASNLTGIIDRLEDLGAVQRRSDPADRRIKNIVATDAGRQLRDALAGRLRGDAGPVSALTEAELSDLHALLQRALGDDRSA